MPQFTYQAFNSARDIVSGSIEAADRASAITTLGNQSLKPIEIKEKGKSLLAGGGDLNIPFLSGHVTGSALVLFTRQLSTMVAAGVPLLRALNGLSKNADSKALSIIVEQVSADIQGGMTLADALAKHPKTFNSVYTNMVRAGEAGGILDDILDRLATQQEKSASMKKKIRGAMAYPLVLLVIVIGAFFGLMIFIIPQIGKIIKNLAGPTGHLPALTTVMLGISDFVLTYWWALLLVIVGGVVAFLRITKTPAGKSAFHHLLLHIPVVKDVIMKTAVARFARTFSALLGAGVSIVEALEVTSAAIGNVVYQEAFKKAIEEVKVGKQLSTELEKYAIFPPIVPQMLSVGEETGKIDTVLLKVADFYEEEVDVTINSLSAIIEPIMIVVMGAMVGLIVASVMGPITSLATQIH